MSRRAGGLGRIATRTGWVTMCALAVILGAALIALGAATYTGAHAVDPVEIDGHVANYTEILIGNSYAHNELRLAGDPHTYVLDSRQFHPTLPERFVQDARISIWVDRGTTNVVALTLYDVMGLNPVAYTTPGSDDPTAALRAAQTQGSAMAFAGLVLVLLVPLGLLVVQLRRRTQTWPRGEAPDAVGRGAGPLEPRPAPMPSARTTAAPQVPLANAPPQSATWPPRVAPSGWPRPGAHTLPPAAGSQAGASSPFPADHGSYGWPPSAAEAGAMPGWDIGDLPTQKRQAQQAPPASPPAVDELPTLKTRAQRTTGGGNPPTETPS